MEKKKVTVVIPIYNVEKYLDKCLNSVINQNYKNLEIICVNDGSLDDSEKIVLRYKLKDKRIIYIKKENGGLSSARNVGIENAKGNYICFVDSDDWIDCNYVSKLVENIEKNDCDISICNIKHVYESGEEKKVSFGIVDNDIVNNYEALKELFVGNILQNHAVNKLYKIELFRSNNISFPIGRIYEDVFTTYKLFLASKKICLFNDYLYYYLQEREGSILTKKFNEKKLDLLDAIDEINNNQDLVKYKLGKYIQIFYIKQVISLFYHIFPFYNSKTKKYFNNIFKKIREHSSHNCLKGFLFNNKLSFFDKIKFSVLEIFPNLYVYLMKKKLNIK